MSDKPIDIPSEVQAVVVREQQVLAPSNLFGASDAVAVVQKATAVATALREVIEKQGLISKIQGKSYPKCEAWTLLGTMLGVFPVLQWSKQLPNGWEARVEARTRDGAIVGAAEAECLKTERNWANRDDFALRSMAQTRATAKALRMPLGFVMTLSGYEPTPAEEMVADHPQNAPERKTTSKAPAPPAPTPPSPKSASNGTVYASQKHLARLCEALAPQKELAERYMKAIDWLLPTETLEKLSLRYVPITKEQFDLLSARLEGCANGEIPSAPYPPNPEPLPPKKPKTESKAAEPAKPLEVPRDPNPDPNSPDAPWRKFPMLFGKDAGRPLAELDKGYLFGLWANWQPQEEWTDKDGKTHKTKPDKLEHERELRQMLDEAGTHYAFKQPEDKE